MLSISVKTIWSNWFETFEAPLGYIDGEFKTFAVDCGSPEFGVFFAAEGPYDYVFNLSALKHVRSEGSVYFDADDRS